MVLILVNNFAQKAPIGVAGAVSAYLKKNCDAKLATNLMPIYPASL